MRKQNFPKSREGLSTDLRSALASGHLEAARVAAMYSGVRALCRLTEHREDGAASAFGPQINVRDAVKIAMFLLEGAARPTEIRDALLALGYDLRRFTFPMARIHNALKVEQEHNNVVSIVLSDGSKKYDLTDRQRHPRRN